MGASVAIDRVLERAEEYFMGRGKLREAAQAIASLLTDEEIPYAIAGALACAAHGHERMTTDIDILITTEGLGRFKANWLGRGYLELASGLKAVRDTARQTRVDFLITGDYPGDGLPKPVAFPHPAEASVLMEPYRVLSLGALLEIKIASGSSAPHRMRDLDDAMRLIRANKLSRDYATQLDPSVRAKFDELWGYAQLEDDY